ncbi:MAG: hypothetical protein IKB13_07500 [Clostridia bacterium]|nr:hypothetical protein [Clostridia bacterium]
MEIMKKSTILVIWLYAILTAIVFSFTFSGVISTTMYSFAVDKSGLVYVGHETEIAVYDNGVEVHSIAPQTSRGYEFTIDENDNIILAAAGTVYKMDLQGNILVKWTDYGNAMYDEIHTMRNHYTAADGTEYTARYPFGRTQIESENGVVWKMKLTDYAVRLLKIAINILFPVVIVREVFRAGRKVDQKSNQGTVL